MTPATTSGTLAGDQPSPLAVLGLGPSEEMLYRALVRSPTMTLEEAARLVGVDEPTAMELVGRLVAAGLVLRRREELVASAPERALSRLIKEEHHRLQTMNEQLTAVQGLLPALEAEHRVSREPRGEPIRIEAISNQEVVPMLRALTLETPGDLLWMRPDQYLLPEGRAADRWVRGLLREGRRSRAIYPARVLEEAPDAVRRRAELGEHVRILGHVPGRLAVIGDTAAMIPHRFEVDEDLVLVVRQPSIVASVTMLFESLWERALIVPGIGGDEAAERASARRLLLDQMARGVKDEQIARTLGLSLRTVRRRVAELLDELDSGSRFQAGVEAVRRGWL